MVNESDGPHSMKMMSEPPEADSIAAKVTGSGVTFRAFGGSCEEFLNNALANRAEWERRGHNIVDNMLKNFCMDEVHGTFDR